MDRVRPVHPGLPQSRPFAGPALHSRHGAESGCFLSGAGSVQSFYDRTPGIVQEAMNRFAEITGRQYRLFDYAGHPQAERVIIIMGSGGETAQQTAEWLNSAAKRPASCACASIGHFRSKPSSARCPPPRAASPCSTAPRNRARSANRFMSMSWRPCAKLATQGWPPLTPNRTSSAGVTAFLPRNSPRRWSNRFSTNSAPHAEKSFYDRHRR
jgi:hypothetical protein